MRSIDEVSADMLKKAHRTGTGGDPPSQDTTPAEELALHLNKGRPVMEGIQGGTVTDSVPASETVRFLQDIL